MLEAPRHDQRVQHAQHLLSVPPVGHWGNADILHAQVLVQNVQPTHSRRELERAHRVPVGEPQLQRELALLVGNKRDAELIIVICISISSSTRSILIFAFLGLDFRATAVRVVLTNSDLPNCGARWRWRWLVNVVHTQLEIHTQRRHTVGCCTPHAGPR